jgi:hypothetical protein
MTLDKETLELIDGLVTRISRLELLHRADAFLYRYHHHPGYIGDPEPAPLTEREKYLAKLRSEATYGGKPTR